MFGKLPGKIAMAVLAVTVMSLSACVSKDPKFSSAAIPDAAAAGDAIMMIGADGRSTLMGLPERLCDDARFGRPIGRPPAGAVTIPCWDGS